MHEDTVITRQKLYAMGEPLGDSATTRKVGGGYVCGGGGGSSSSSNATTTNNTDKRITLQSGTAITADDSSVYITNNTLDKDVVGKAMDTVSMGNIVAMGAAGDAFKNVNNSFSKLLDSQGDNYENLLYTTEKNNALQSDGFVKMLGLADKLFTGAGEALKSTQATTMAQVGALTTAQNDAKGAIDQKTIVILAAAGVAGLALMTRGKK